MRHICYAPGAKLIAPQPIGPSQLVIQIAQKRLAGKLEMHIRQDEQRTYFTTRNNGSIVCLFCSSDLRVQFLLSNKVFLDRMTDQPGHGAGLCQFMLKTGSLPLPFFHKLAFVSLVLLSFSSFH